MVETVSRTVVKVYEPAGKGPVLGDEVVALDGAAGARALDTIVNIVSIIFFGAH